MPLPKVKQATLGKGRDEVLKKLIQDDISQDSADLERRNKALTKWYKLWRAAMEPNGFPEQEKSNFTIPMVLWQILAKLSKELDALLGEESEISVAPIGQTDVDRVPKVSRWMNWRIKNSLRLFKKLYIYLLQKNVLGTSIGHLEWVTRKRKVKELVPVEEMTTQTDPETGLPMSVPVTRMQEQEKEVVDFDGPEFTVENLEDWLIPSTATSIEDSDHFIRRLRLSMDEILDLVDEGKFNKLSKDEIAEFRRLATTGKDDTAHSGHTDMLGPEKNAQQGIPDVPQGREEKITVWNWCGNFRLNEDDDRSEQVVSFYQQDKNKLLGACRLVDIHPDGRWPFLHSQAIMDINTFWGIGIAELLESINDELDAFYRLAVSAGEGAIGPVVFYNPASGYIPEKQRIEPNTAIPCADPNLVKVVNLGQIQLAPYAVFLQQLLGFGERLTGLTDAQLGRQFDRPNAPRTFGQQALLQQESNVRLLLDIRLERENLKELLKRIWEMDKRWLPKPIFFRLTEEDPGDVMVEDDFMGNFDFDIGPVTSVSNKAVRTQELMQVIALSQAIPPAYLAGLKKLFTKLGYADIAALIPDPKAIKPPMTPEEENVRLLQGEDVDPHPMDNHAAHIAKHSELIRRIQESELIPGIPMETMNPGAVGRIQAHIAEHEQVMKGGMMLTGSPVPQNGTGAGSPLAGPLAGIMQQLGLGQPNNPNQQANSDIASRVNVGNLNLR